MAGSMGAGLARVDMRSKLSTVTERIRMPYLIQYIGVMQMFGNLYF